MSETLTGAFKWNSERKSIDGMKKYAVVYMLHVQMKHCIISTFGYETFCSAGILCQ